MRPTFHVRHAEQPQQLLVTGGGHGQGQHLHGSAPPGGVGGGRGGITVKVNIYMGQPRQLQVNALGLCLHGAHHVRHAEQPQQLLSRGKVKGNNNNNNK